MYFPDTAMISNIAFTAEGECVETGVIGWEGIAGIDALLGSSSMLNENVVQLPGSALRIRTKAVIKEFKRGGAFQDLALKFIRLRMIQIGQTALCNRLHTVEED